MISKNKNKLQIKIKDKINKSKITEFDNNFHIKNLKKNQEYNSNLLI